MQYAQIHTLFDKTCITNGVPGFKNVDSPYGAAVSMASYIMYITLFHIKYMCLGLC